jgi:hypothetical protein
MSHNVRNEENLGPIAQNRRRRNKTLTRATGLGLCVAILPIPQMLTIALLAIPLRLNLPVAMSCVFVTNPLTMAPAFYMNYRIGAWALQTPSWEAPDHLTMQTLAEQWDFIWLPLYTGSLLACCSPITCGEAMPSANGCADQLRGRRKVSGRPDATISAGRPATISVRRRLQLAVTPCSDRGFR